MAHSDSNKTSYIVVGYLLAVVQAILYASLSIFGKLLYATGLDSQQVVMLRFLSMTVLLGAFLIVWRRVPLIRMKWATFIQGVFFFITALFYLLAVEHLTAGMTTVIFYMFPAVVAVMNVFVFKEPFSPAVAIALILAFAGLVLVSGMIAGGVVLDALGIAYGVISCVCFAIYTVLIQKLGRDESPLTATFTIALIGLVASCIVFAPTVPTLLQLDTYQIVVAGLMGLLGTILPVVIYMEAIKRIGGTKAALISISETPFTLMLAFIILGETLTMQQTIGSALIIASVAVVSIEPLMKGKSSDQKPNSERKRVSE